MNWNEIFAGRTRHIRRSAVRELLKLTSQPDMISFAGGLPAPELFPVAEIQRATDTILRQRAGRALQYGQTEGLPELRDWLAASFVRSGLEFDRANILVTTGSQQGLDLIGRVLLDPEDVVLVENPAYMAALSAWRPLEVRFEAMPSDEDGIRTDELGPLLDRGAKMLYCIPNFQNPQGTTLTLDRRLRLINALRGRQTVLLEDDPYCELRFEGERLPTLLELEGKGGSSGGGEAKVVYLGSCSKILSPGLRVGWVAGPKPLIEKLGLAKQATDLHTSSFCQEIVLELLREGLLEKHIPLLRRAYHERCQTMLRALAAHFPAGSTWTRPKGGMFLFVTLPRGLRSADLLKKALEMKTAFVPGEEFYWNGEGKNTLRLNFSHSSPALIETGIQRLAAALQTMDAS
jgi:2-aminoadipate transaminase